MFYYRGQGGASPFMNYGSAGGVLKAAFKNGSALTRIVFINIAVYLAIKFGWLVSLILAVPEKEYFSTINFLLDLPGEKSVFIAAPWTVFTYMFTHYRFLHLLLNMFFLMWFGNKLKKDVSASVFWGIYVLGGVTGAVLYLFVAPMMETDLHGLAGASASVMAVMAARCVYAWKDSVNFFLLGNIRNLYLLLFFIFLTLINIPHEGGVESVVHLGGIAVGIAAGFLMLFTVKSPYRSFRSRRNPRMEFSGNYRGNGGGDGRPCTKRECEDRLNDILDKVSNSGYESLTAEEKSILFKSGQHGRI